MESYSLTCISHNLAELIMQLIDNQLAELIIQLTISPVKHIKLFREDVLFLPYPIKITF